MASADEVVLNESHKPHANAVEAFKKVEVKIKEEILRSRDTYGDPRMWSRASGVSNHDLIHFHVAEDLVLVRSGPTTYGTIIFGKIRIPAIQDGYVHVRIHDPPNQGTDDVKFHSILTDEGVRDENGHSSKCQAVQHLDTPLEFFNE